MPCRVGSADYSQERDMADEKVGSSRIWGCHRGFFKTLSKMLQLVETLGHVRLLLLVQEGISKGYPQALGGGLDMK